MRIEERIYESEDPYLKWLKKTKGLSKTTVWHYYTYYKDFIKLDPTQENIESFLQSKNNNSVARAFIRSLLQFLKVEKDFEIPKIKQSKKNKKIIRDLSEKQIEEIRKYSYNKSIKDGLIFDIAYYGALRRKELIPIKISDLGWSDWFDNPNTSCSLKILGKGAKEREVLIPGIVIKKLLDHYFKIGILNSKMDVDYILNYLNSNNNILFDGLYEKKIWKIIKRNSFNSIGIGIRPHELRHTRATEMENKNINIRDIQHYLGHTTPQITEIYLHTTQKKSIKNIREVLD